MHFLTKFCMKKFDTCQCNIFPYTLFTSRQIWYNNFAHEFCLNSCTTPFEFISKKRHPFQGVFFAYKGRRNQTFAVNLRLRMLTLFSLFNNCSPSPYTADAVLVQSYGFLVCLASCICNRTKTSVNSTCVKSNVL